MFVFFSKMLPQLIYPTGLICVLLLITLFFCKSAKAKNRLILIALLIFFVCGNKLPGAFLIRKLENKYPPFDGKETAGAIVVLGGATESKSFPRQTVEVNGAGDRILYAVSLYREGLAEKILCGGSYIDWLEGETIVDGSVSSPATEMAEIAVMMGVPKEAILIQNKSLNTHEEAVMDMEMLKAQGISKIILVTSAAHMPRSAALFEKQGLEVIPAPTDYSYSDTQWEEIRTITPKNAYTYIIPSTGNLRTFENALKEYIGYYVYQAKGWL